MISVVNSTPKISVRKPSKPCRRFDSLQTFSPRFPKGGKMLPSLMRYSFLRFIGYRGPMSEDRGPAHSANRQAAYARWISYPLRCLRAKKAAA